MSEYKEALRHHPQQKQTQFFNHANMPIFMSAQGDLVSFCPFGTSFGIAVGRRSGGRLATTAIFTILFSFFFFVSFLVSPSSTFLIEGVL